MPVLSLVYYRNLSLLSESCKAKALDVSSFYTVLPRVSDSQLIARSSQSACEIQTRKSGKLPQRESGHP